MASVTVQPILPFNTGLLRATYTGGGDLAPAAAEIEPMVNPIGTTTTLQSLPLSVVNPLTLRAEVRSNITLPSMNPSPLTGTVQFFNGTLFIGSAALTLDVDGVQRATLGNVMCPVGTRVFKATYLGKMLFTTSTSAVVQTAVQ